MSETSQSIFRATLLAAVTAMFVAVWSADASRTGMTLARRNQLVVPAHMMARSADAAALARRIAVVAPVHAIVPRAAILPMASRRKTSSPEASAPLAAGTYRVVYGDGRVEWLRVIDRQSTGATAPASRVTTTELNGETVHLIRIADESATIAR